MELKIDYHNHDRELINDCCKSALWQTVGSLNVIAVDDGSYYSEDSRKLATRILNMIQENLQPVLVKPDKERKVKIIVGK
jgi:hypothetical protein